MFKVAASLIALCSICACSTPDNQSVNGPTSTPDRIGKAIVSPLNDINVVKENIPTVLSDAIKNPYQAPADSSCAAITEQVKKFDVALGPDLDATIDVHDKSMTEKGSVHAQDEAVGTVERTITGAIPFRSWIRKFSGAEKRSKEMSAAIAAGIVRRAYLKGMGQEKGCDYPAAPAKQTSATESK